MAKEEAGGSSGSVWGYDPTGGTWGHFDTDLVGPGSFHSVKRGCGQAAPPFWEKEKIMKKTMFLAEAVLLLGGLLACTANAWETNAATTFGQPPPYRPKFWGLAFLPDGKQLLTASDHGLILWDVNTGEKLRVMGKGKYSQGVLALSIDGKLALESGLPPSLGLWDIVTGKRVGVLDRKQTWVHAIAISPNNQFALVGGSGMIGDDVPKRLELADNLQLWDITRGEVIHRLTGHKGNVIAVAFSSDGKLGLSASSDETPTKYTIKLWDLEKRKLLRGYDSQDRIGTVCFSQNDKWMYSLGVKVRAWDIKSGDLIHDVASHGSKEGSGPLAFSADKRYYLTLEGGSLNNSLTLWDIHTGRAVRRLREMRIVEVLK